MVAKKRGNNEGSIFFYSRKKLWRAMVTIDGHRLGHYGKTRQECANWLKETLAQIDKGLTYDASQIKVGEFLEDWLVSIKSNIKPTTCYNYNLAVHKHIIPALGKLLMKDLRPDIVQRFYDKKLKNGTSKFSLQSTHRVLHKALSHAVVLGMISRNPTEGVVVPRPENKEMKFYNEIQSNQLLMAVKGTRNEALFHLVLSTGMRQSELVALKWSDLDWRNKTISISRQLMRNSKSEEEYFSTLKTQAGYRTISLGDHTIKKLRDHLNLQNEERKNPPREEWIENDLIFPSIVGTPMNQSNLYKSFKSIIKEAGLPEIRFHDLRHTAASIMLNHGVPVIVVSKRLGHAKVSITMDIYGHLIPEMQSGIGQLMDDLIAPIELQTIPSSTTFEFVEKEE